MGQLKNNWKKELLQKEIEPSKDVWLNVANGLQQSESKSTKKIILGVIAAILIIGVFVAPQWFQKAEETSTHKKVVQEESPKKINNSLVEEENSSFIKGNNNNDKLLTNIQPKAGNQLSTEKTSKSTAIIAEENTENETKLKVNESENEAAVLLAEVEAELEAEKQLTNPDEIEVLMAKAEKNIEGASFNRLIDFAEAHQLLAEVEEDLSKKDLKERIFKFLKNNYKEIESAIASLK